MDVSKVIAFTAPGIAEVQTENVGAPSHGQVQVRIEVSTISSGTEKANLLGDSNLSPDGGKVTFPRYLGYSSAGTVTAVGEGVRDISVGDRVSVSWSRHTRLQNVAAQNVYKLPDSVSFSDAALFHISIFPLAAIRKCRLEIGESAIVMGLGVLGLVSIPLLRLSGAARIIAVDPIPETREKALSIGADYALDPFDPEFSAKAKALTGGGAKVGIEVTGIGAGLDGILDCMALKGRVALLGCTRNSDFTIDYYRKVHGPGITLIGAHTAARPAFESSNGWWTQIDDISSLKKLTEMGRIKLSSIIDETHSPTEATKVYSRLVTEKTFPIVQFDWRNLK
jgi:threonine dehydrogenase-like Zn-dependent dehydrogenase